MLQSGSLSKRLCSFRFPPRTAKYAKTKSCETSNLPKPPNPQTVQDTTQKDRSKQALGPISPQKVQTCPIFDGVVLGVFRLGVVSPILNRCPKPQLKCSQHSPLRVRPVAPV
eukprot:2185188-Amphidinium_carterae.1